MNCFCTHFDIGYLPQGRALHDSLMRHGGDFTLTILCLDTEVEQKLRELGLPHTRLLPLADLEASDPQILTAKGNRRKAEYYFTLKSCLCHFLLSQDKEVELLHYVDADIAFFSAVDPFLAELEGFDAAVTPHRFAEQYRWREIYGRFNAGWASFRRTAGGLACLQWWKERCLEWCHDIPDDGRFADQKYLETLGSLFPNVLEVSHPGANLAPWNLREQELALNEGAVEVLGHPLVFYHFSGIERLSTHVFDSGLGEYGATPGNISRQHIFEPYFRSLVRYTGTALAPGTSPSRSAEKRSISAIIVLRPAPEEGVSLEGYVEELECMLLDLESRQNRCVAARDATIRSIDAAGLWLGELARYAAAQWKRSLAATHKQIAAASRVSKSFWQRLGAGGSPGTTPVTKLAEGIHWPPDPAQILEQLRSKQEATDTPPSDGATMVSSLDGRSLFTSCSARSLAVASQLSAAGKPCTVLGCPGWLKRYSTEHLRFVLSPLSEYTDEIREEGADFENILVDSHDLGAWNAFNHRLGVLTRRIILLDRSIGHLHGLDLRCRLREFAPLTPP